MSSATRVRPAGLAVAASSAAGARLRASLRFARVQPFVAACMLVLAVLVVSAIAPGLLAPDSPTAMAITSPRTPPSAAHLFGTDQFGRDILSRVIHGVRLSLSIGVLSTLLGVVVGGSIGLVFGFLGGLSDAFAMRVVDVMLAFPSVLLALTIVAVSGPSLVNLILAIGIASVPEYARIVRGQVLSIRERPFMEAAIAAGTRRSGLLLTHVLPNVLSPVLVVATLGIGFAMLAGASLSFIGLGPQPPSPEWGAMLSDGRSYLQDSWWIGVFPGLAILITVVAINVVGQWLQVRLDPKRLS